MHQPFKYDRDDGTQPSVARGAAEGLAVPKDRNMRADPKSLMTAAPKELTLGVQRATTLQGTVASRRTQPAALMPASQPSAATNAYSYPSAPERPSTRSMQSAHSAGHWNDGWYSAAPLKAEALLTTDAPKRRVVQPYSLVDYSELHGGVAAQKATATSPAYPGSNGGCARAGLPPAGRQDFAEGEASRQYRLDQAGGWSNAHVDPWSPQAISRTPSMPQPGASVTRNTQQPGLSAARMDGLPTDNLQKLSAHGQAKVVKERPMWSCDFDHRFGLHPDHYPRVCHAGEVSRATSPPLSVQLPSRALDGAAEFQAPETGWSYPIWYPFGSRAAVPHSNVQAANDRNRPLSVALQNAADARRFLLPEPHDGIGSAKVRKATQQRLVDRTHNSSTSSVRREADVQQPKTSLLLWPQTPAEDRQAIKFSSASSGARSTGTKPAAVAGRSTGPPSSEAPIEGRASREPTIQRQTGNTVGGSSGARETWGQLIDDFVDVGIDMLSDGEASDDGTDDTLENTNESEHAWALV